MPAAPPADAGRTTCPGCLASLAPDTASCPWCRVPLTGPLVGQLRQLDQQITHLRLQRADLMAALRASVQTAEPAGYGRSTDTVTNGAEPEGSAHAPASGATALVAGHPRPR